MTDECGFFQHLYRTMRYGEFFYGRHKYDLGQPKCGFRRGVYSYDSWCFHFFGFYIGGFDY